MGRRALCRGDNILRPEAGKIFAGRRGKEGSDGAMRALRPTNNDQYITNHNIS
jgi:hypothetical protein